MRNSMFYNQCMSTCQIESVIKTCIESSDKTNHDES